MSKMTSTEMTRIGFLIDALPEYSGTDGIHLRQISVFDDSGEELGYINIDESLFVAFA